MKIDNPTQEQVAELAARCVYLLRELRSWQRTHEETIPAIYMNKGEEVVQWENRADEFLKNIGAVEWESLKDLLGQLIINTK